MPVLILGLAAVLLFICGFAVWSLTSATNSAVARLRAQVSTEVANIIPPLAAAPRPTDPIQPAEPTPWPTFTPQPAAPPPASNPSPNPTQAVVIEKLLSQSCKNALNNLQQLSDQISSKPTIAFDSQWRSDLSQAVADMKTNCGTLDAASPVPGLISQAHQNLALAQNEFDQAGKLFDEGVQNLDPGKLLEAGQHVTQAVKYLNQSLTELKKIGN